MTSEPERAKSRRQRTSFEDSFAKLEQTVQQLEAGGLSLEQATKLYEDGMRLAKQCNEMLSATELKITKLQTSYGQQMQMVDSATPEDADEDEKSPD
ncbi:MAG: exodeoxyribonuclease VII small subunit [Dehalococcoidia bacterium]|nr:exodeoxyribonuclease VII small subunit [Dehalococcoidia bacterium]